MRTFGAPIINTLSPSAPFAKILYTLRNHVKGSRRFAGSAVVAS